MAEVLIRKVEQLASPISNETDGDKTAESLLNLLGLLKNGKRANEIIGSVEGAVCLLSSCCS